MTSDRYADAEILSDAAAIRQGTTRLARVIRSGRPAGALSTNKISVLGRLRSGGPSTPSEIAAADRQQPQSLTRVFAELAQAGLIVRTAAEDDRRQSIISLTQAGLAALDRDLAERDAWLAREIADLSDTERGVLLLAVRIMERIADRRPRQDARVSTGRPQ
jgi:DNA-binding MarR family transcriptional regulator